jgi:hypothetical protein
MVQGTWLEIFSAMGVCNIGQKNLAIGLRSIGSERRMWFKQGGTSEFSGYRLL